MNVTVWRDEMYPAYHLADDEYSGGGTVDVDDETLARWRRVEAEWETMQQEMQALLAANPAYFDGRYWHI